MASKSDEAVGGLSKAAKYAKKRNEQRKLAKETRRAAKETGAKRPTPEAGPNYLPMGGTLAKESDDAFAQIMQKLDSLPEDAAARRIGLGAMDTIIDKVRSGRISREDGLRAADDLMASLMEGLVE
jgi:hypothetical protein